MARQDYGTVTIAIVSAIGLASVKPAETKVKLT